MPPVVKRQSPAPERARPARESGSILDEAKAVTEMETPGIRMTVFGRNGTGKTTFASTFPKPLLILGFEDGTKSIRSVKGVEFIRIDDTLKVFKVEEAIRANPGRYRTIVMDTITSLQDLVLKELMGLEEVPVQMSWGLVKKDQYRFRSERTKELTRKIMWLPVENVIILGQEKDHTKRNEDGTVDSSSTYGDIIKPFIGPSVGQSVCDWICENVDYICQTFVRNGFREESTEVAGETMTQMVRSDEVEFCLRTERGNPIFASKIRADRRTKVPPMIVDPDYEKFAKAMRGETS